MGEALIDRRSLLAIGAAGGVAALTGPLAAATRSPSVETLKVGARALQLSVWRPARPHGVALFSHGHGSWPDRYAVLTDLLTASGYAVAAPLHVDSMRHPDRARFSVQASFGERLADMGAAAGHAAQAFPGLPMVAVGHSFGTLTCACLGGALAYVGAFRNPAIRAILGFSTPGRIPGLVQPAAYSSLQVPMMVVTGTADTVPGFVADPADHLLPVADAGSPRYGLVMDGAAHEFIADARGLASLRPGLMAFLDGYGRGDAAQRARLDKWQAPRGARLMVKKA